MYQPLTENRMYKRAKYKVSENIALTSSVYRMRLEGDTEWITRPGQFVNIELEGLYLRRPISICDWDEQSITIIYKVVGRGTEQMSRMAQGEVLDVLTGLGNGFNADTECHDVLLVGGGVGVPPLYRLAKDLLGRGRKVNVVLGFGTKAELFYEAEFCALGADVYVSTVDGSAGVKGFVTDAIREHDIAFDYFYACGPMPMLKALCKSLEWPGEVSLDERMACGFGVCMCCSVETRSGAKRICKEGPVFRKEDLIWKEKN